jgi:chromosome segregation protein
LGAAIGNFAIPGNSHVRLIKLKIAGFKSFVEPTVVLFPGQLAGVVGPNGCGKSNIIDAVRWVLGESKASELRGESIQDVIFKGSGHRKEVSRASVELFFDNAQARAAGQWSQYAEITVKRVLDREGNSSYYINNLHVRRRDVIDLFLGTGLGPRAYAIIGQGMISRIVEAKPDELRFFLEEAAGVTKYKERRKETGHRLDDARENLARVDDIRNELDTQVIRLESQAEVAREYKDLQSTMARTQTVLWLKKRNDARTDSERLRRAVEEAVNSVEGETAQLREIEARVEIARETHFTASDALHEAQAAMYAANTDVTRLETEIRHMMDSRQRLESRLVQLGAEQTHWRNQLATLAQDETRWSALLENSRGRSETSSERHDEALERLPEAEDAVQACAQEVAEARRELGSAEQALRLAEADKSHAQRAIDQLATRRQRLDADRLALGAPDPALLAQSQAAEALAAERLDEAQLLLADLQTALPEAESLLRNAREALQGAHRQLTETRARHDALQALQAKVAQSGDMGSWLAGHGLKDAKPLWQAIQVDAGWETAVEAVLRERFSALLGDADIARQALDGSKAPGIVALGLPGQGGASAAPLQNSLRSKVRCLDARWESVLDDWLAGVGVADELSAQIPISQGVLVSRQGHVLTPHALTLYVPDARTHGVIERAREIDELAARLDALGDAEEHARAAQLSAEQALATHQSELTNTRRRVQECQQARHATQVEALKLSQAQARFVEQSSRIDADLADITRQSEHEEAARERAEETLMLQGERLGEVRQNLDTALDMQRQRDTALRDIRALEQQLAREAQEASFAERECLSKLEDNARANETASNQIERIVMELDATDSDLAMISDEVLREQLHNALDSRQDTEAALAQRRNVLEGAASELRALDEQRAKLEQGVEPLREKINELRLKAQAAQLNEEQYRERLLEVHIATDEDEAAYADDLAKGQRDSTLQGEITRLGNAIEALGPVNLAALDELATARERKGFLDSQSGDLAQAIGTLEDAIRRIDRETREQLQTTYDSVNSQFGTLFPQLFGGGEARLILTGEEILDAGIQIMAQPPGKKNSTIHLLSGGEKALTAIALVFALFHLNPAPFCMLDEVDAPLDDSNTVRFCEMVKRMSATTQFIFISHNKIAMEMAQQLIGVTMQEQGVSRVVEVDMFEAMRLAESKVGA